MSDHQIPPEIIRTLSDQAQSIAVLTERVAHLSQNYTDLKKGQDTIATEIDEIHEMANRWKGGVAVVLGLGGLLGFLISIADKVVKVWR